MHWRKKNELFALIKIMLLAAVVLGFIALVMILFPHLKMLVSVIIQLIHKITSSLQRLI